MDFQFPLPDGNLLAPALAELARVRLGLASVDNPSILYWGSLPKANTELVIYLRVQENQAPLFNHYNSRKSIAQGMLEMLPASLVAKLISPVVFRVTVGVKLSPNCLASVCLADSKSFTDFSLP